MLRQLVSFSLAGLALACRGPTGEPGVDALVRAEPEPPGINCPAGGVAIQTGSDVDMDGDLSDDEVTDTAYVCNGISGMDGTSCTVFDDGAGTTIVTCSDGTSAIVNDGADGDSYLIRLNPEPPGTNCANGGTAVYSGIDVDQSGALEDAEIVDTAYLCDGLSGPTGTLEGSYTIRNSFDVTVLAGVTEVTGWLTIAGGGLMTVALPALVTVGYLEASSTNLSTLSLPALVYAGGVSVEGNYALASLELPAIAAVLGNFSLRYLDALSSLAGLENLATAGSVNIWQNVLLTDLSGLSGLTSASNLSIVENGALSSLGLTSLDVVSSYLEVVSNPVLPTCLVSDLLAQLTTSPAPASINVTGNDDAATCP